MLGIKNVRHGWIFKGTKKTAKSHKPKVKKDCASQKFVATILVTHVTILTEPDLSLQN